MSRVESSEVLFLLQNDEESPEVRGLENENNTITNDLSMTYQINRELQQLKPKETIDPVNSPETVGPVSSPVVLQWNRKIDEAPVNHLESGHISPYTLNTTNRPTHGSMDPGNFVDGIGVQTPPIDTQLSTGENDRVPKYTHDRSLYHQIPVDANMAPNRGSCEQTINVCDSCVCSQLPHASVTIGTQNKTQPTKREQHPDTSYIPYFMHHTVHGSNVNDYAKRCREWNRGRPSTETEWEREQRLTRIGPVTNHPDYTSGFSEDPCTQNPSTASYEWKGYGIIHSPTAQQLPEILPDTSSRTDHVHLLNPVTNCLERKSCVSYSSEVIPIEHAYIRHNAGCSNDGATSQETIQHGVSQRSHQKVKPTILPTQFIDNRHCQQNPGLVANIPESCQTHIQTQNFRYHPTQGMPVHALQNYQTPVKYSSPSGVSYIKVLGNKRKRADDRNPPYFDMGESVAFEQVVGQHRHLKMSKVDTAADQGIIFREATGAETCRPMGYIADDQLTSGSLYSLIESVSWDDSCFVESFDVDAFLDYVKSDTGQGHRRSDFSKTKSRTDSEDVCARLPIKQDDKDRVMSYRHTRAKLFRGIRKSVAHSTLSENLEQNKKDSCPKPRIVYTSVPRQLQESYPIDPNNISTEVLPKHENLTNLLRTDNTNKRGTAARTRECVSPFDDQTRGNIEGQLPVISPHRVSADLHNLKDSQVQSVTVVGVPRITNANKTCNTALSGWPNLVHTQTHTNTEQKLPSHSLKQTNINTTDEDCVISSIQASSTAETGGSHVATNSKTDKIDMEMLWKQQLRSNKNK